jgi:AraC-like DNA-binding protein
MKTVHLPSRHLVRAAIAASLRHGDATIHSTARQLQISVRTLQRHLAQMGTSYSEMLAEIRVDTACHLLTGSDRPLSEIAVHLGYANASCFSRTFFRLMKIQPIIYRRQRFARKRFKVQRLA